MADHITGPRLSERVQEQIESEQEAVHNKYWPQVSALSVHIPSSSPPIRKHKKLLRLVSFYACELFDPEAKQYPQDWERERWLTELGQEVFDGLVKRLSFLNLGYHASQNEITEAIMESLYLRVNQHLALFGSVPLEPVPVPIKKETHIRLSATVSSPQAARRMERYLQEKGMGLTDFAGNAQTTDRTLRSFRKTGKVRRDIFRSIAKAMGITPDELLRG